MQELRMLAGKDQNVELDLEAFENEIGKEIDALFIPTGIADEAIEPEPKAPAQQLDFGMGKKPAEAKPPTSVQTSEQEISFADAFSLEVPSEPPPAQGLQPEIDLTADLAFDTMAPMTMEAPPEPIQETNRADEIRKCVESFEIAYLSLDWDFSPVNVRNLAGSLDRLEEHCTRTHETDSLYKILRAVLNHLASRPDGIPVEVNEVMRDAQSLLKRMLLSEGNIQAEDKQQLKTVIARVQSIKQKSLKKDETQPALSKTPAPAKDELPGADLRSSYEVKEIENADYYRLERMIEWVEASRQQLNTIHSRLHEENVRLKKIEEICQKKPALAPLANRMAAIQGSIQQQVNALWDRELEWQKSGDWLREMVARYASRSPIVATTAPPQTTPAQEEPIPAADPVVEPKIQAELHSLPEDQVCAFNLSGRVFAVPASNVVKVEPISHKKYMKIMKRGYASLNDFKPFFKSLKHGLYSAWQGVPAGILKNYQFIPISAESLPVTELSGDVGGLILLSNGTQHALIAMDSANVDQYIATIAESGKNGPVCGTTDNGLGQTAELLDVEWLLNELYGNETVSH
ncbi:MAG: hypothetical protein AB9873_04245 [Syntrophobacteraceae bacterium]